MHAWLFLVMYCRKWVLSKFSDNKFLLNLLFVLIKTLLIFFLNSEGWELVIIMLVSKGKGKGKVHPITGHEDPEGSRGLALLFH